MLYIIFFEWYWQKKKLHQKIAYQKKIKISFD